MTRCLQLAFLLWLCATGAWGQPYPAKPVRVVVPWPPAGVTDVLTRALTQALSPWAKEV